MYAIHFGRSDDTVVKHYYPSSRTRALRLANALCFVLMGTHDFKPSQCHDKKRVEGNGFFVEFDPDSPSKQ